MVVVEQPPTVSLSRRLIFMFRIDLTLSDPLANVALDEALLEVAEASEEHSEVLRLWQPASPLVVIGRSSPWQTEVKHSFCQQHQIPVVRRCSGGQSIVTGPGCLMYAVLLDYRLRPELRLLDRAHLFVMSKMQAAVKTLGINAEISGTSDLTVDGQKVSGNALRCKRNWFVYHGTMICDLDIDLIANCLGKPIRQPAYRQQRDHRSFLAQLDTSVSELMEAIATTWSATFEADPNVATLEKLKEQCERLTREKYSTVQWNEKV